MKARNIIQLIFNLLALAGEIIAILICAKIIAVPNTPEVSIEGPIDLVKYFSMIGSLVVGLSLIVALIGNIYSLSKKEKCPNGIFAVKMIGVATGLSIFLLTLLYYLPKTGNPFSVGDAFTAIVMCYAVPLLFACSTMFLDLDKKWSFKYTFLAPLAMVIYLAYSLPLFISGTWEDVYQILPYFQSNTWWKGLLLILAFVFGSYLLGFVVWLINRIIYLIFVGDEVSQEISEEEKEVAKIVPVTKEDEVIEKQEEEEVIKAGYFGPRIYHISRHNQDGRWQVKFANGKRAIKITDTQAEAIVFAKQLVKVNGGSLRVHSVKGRIRKA